MIDLATIPFDERNDQNTVPGLARITKESETNILAAMIAYDNNLWLLPTIYRLARGDVTYPGHISARDYLKDNINDLAYQSWQLPVRVNASITSTPITEEFKCEVMTYRLQAQKQQLRAIRSRAQFYVDALKRLNFQLSTALDDFEISMQGNIEAVSYISASKTLVDLMVKYPKESGQVVSDEIKTLQTNMATLETLATRDFIDAPKHRMIQKRQQKVIDNALYLRQWWEVEELIEIIGYYRRYLYLVTSTQFDQLSMLVGESFTLLMRSPQKKYIRDHWLDTLLEIVDSDSQEENRAELDFGTTLAACDALMLAASMVPTMPGPASFSVALMNAIGPKLLGRAMKQPALAAGFVGIYTRFIQRRGNLNDAQLAELKGMLNGPPKTHAEIGDWVESNFQASRNWCLIMGVVNLALLMASIYHGEDETIARWINLGNISLASNSAAAFFKALSTVQRFRGCQLMTIASEALGVIAGVCALASAWYAAREDAATGDSWGATLDYAAAFCAGLALAGCIAVYLISAGIMAEFTVLGAPIGGVLMVLGIIIGVGATIWDFIRTWYTARTHMHFEGFINYLCVDGGHWTFLYALNYDRHLYPDMIAVFDEVKEGHHEMSFWYLVPEQHEVLFKDVLHNAEYVANAVDIEKSDLENQYPAVLTYDGWVVEEE